MKKAFSYLPIFLSVVATIACGKETKNSIPNAETPSAQLAGTPVVFDNSKLTFDLYQKLKDQEGNLFFSPYSISSALAMTCGGARGNTEKEMITALSFPAEQKMIHQGISTQNSTINRINSAGNVQLTVANSLFPQKGYPLLPAYVQLLKKEYALTITPQDYGNSPEKARLNINSWVETKTEKKITNLISEGVLNKATNLVLVNAIYFKGNWKTTFDKNLTTEADFFSAKKSTVQMMSGKSNYLYTEDSSVQVIELPYKGEELSMMVILPKEKGELKVVEQSLTSEKVQNWISSMSESEIALSLPKFKIEWGTFPLDPALKALGMIDAFTDNADFSGMSGKKDLFISTVLHKAFVEVNEEGSEAAAATAVVMTRAMVQPEPTQFRADHPFIFMIRERLSGTVLFMGRFENK